VFKQKIKLGKKKEMMDKNLGVEKKDQWR